MNSSGAPLEHPAARASSPGTLRSLLAAAHRVSTGLRSLSGEAAVLAQALATVPTEEIEASFETLIELRALVEGLSVAVLDQAVQRGLVSDPAHPARPVGPQVAAWVRARAAGAGMPLTPAMVGTYRRVWEHTQRPELAPLAAAIHAGRICPPVGARLGADLWLLSSVLPPDWWAAAAGELIEYAASGASTAQLGSLRETLIAAHGPHGAFETEQAELHQHRYFTTPVKDASGRWVGTYAMDHDAHAALTAALDALAAPCRTTEGHQDARDSGQRNLDALIEMCRVVATDPTLLGHVRPVSAVKAQVIVTIDADTMAARLNATGYGVDGHGHPLTPATIRRLACDAHLIPAVLGSDSAVLDLGRTARLATPDQIRYLRLRDKGCTFPGCTRPPSWCEAHHLHEWAADHGPTNVDQLALLCTRHHTDVHTHGLHGELHDGHIRWRPHDTTTPARAA